VKGNHRQPRPSPPYARTAYNCVFITSLNAWLPLVSLTLSSKVRVSKEA
jgi:hypothetical protein